MATPSPLIDSFQAVIDRAEGRSAPSTAAGNDADTASAAFASLLGDAILPRRITLHGAGDARLSVIARNRKVVRVEEVCPPDLWSGADDPDRTPCSADFNAFARDFAGTVLAVCARGETRTETGLIGGDAPSSALSGYPASHLSDHLEQVGKGGSTDTIAAFHDAWPGHMRALSKADDPADLPEGAPVDATWMRARLAEWVEACPEDGLHLRFVTIAGARPVALALAGLDGEHCAVLSHAPEDFTRLEAALAALRDDR